MSSANIFTALSLYSSSNWRGTIGRCLVLFNAALILGHTSFLLLEPIHGWGVNRAIILALPFYIVFAACPLSWFLLRGIPKPLSVKLALGLNTTYFLLQLLLLVAILAAFALHRAGVL